MCSPLASLANSHASEFFGWWWDIHLGLYLISNLGLLVNHFLCILKGHGALLLQHALWSDRLFSVSRHWAWKEKKPGAEDMDLWRRHYWPQRPNGRETECGDTLGTHSRAPHNQHLHFVLCLYCHESVLLYPHSCDCNSTHHIKSHI